MAPEQSIAQTSAESRRPHPDYCSLAVAVSVIGDVIMTKTYTEEELAEMSDDELKEDEAVLNDMVFGYLKCYSTTDMRNLELVRWEMDERGLDLPPLGERPLEDAEDNTVVFEDTGLSIL